MYAVPHDHRRYGRGHGERVAATILLASSVPAQTVADLSCGNAAIATALCPSPVLGDAAPGYPIHGPIEETLLQIEPVDMLILSETLEHVDNPQLVLARIADKTRILILSTPLECWGDTNAEHLWAWDRDAVEALAGEFTVKAFTHVDSTAYGEPYDYGIWHFEQ